MSHFDIAILGAGPGGYVAAIRAAQLGARVAIVEKDKIGGVCLNVGCIPTKKLVQDAQLIRSTLSGPQRGVKSSLSGIDLSEIISTKDQVANQLTMGVNALLKANNISVFNGIGAVELNKTITISGKSEQSISYDNLIIATGSSPAIPPVKGFDLPSIYTSTELLSTRRLPKHLIIIGGGVIGCEFASIFRTFGSEITIIEMLPRLLPNMDTDVSQMLQRAFKSEKIDVNVGTKVDSVSDDNGEFTVVTSKNGEQKTIVGDAVLLSVGRTPNLSGLENLDLEFNNQHVKVDEYMQTNIDNTYAIGDVTGIMELAHVASFMGVQVVENILSTEKKVVDLSLVPSCVFTYPEIASVGMTESIAKEKYGEILVGRFPMVASGKALSMGETNGNYKIIADKKTGKILGAHLVGAQSTELISTIAAYINMQATLEDLDKTIFAHPTLSESIMEAALDAENRCIHMPPKN